MTTPQGFLPNSGHGDLAQIQATMQAIEFACRSIQINVNPAAAEATLLSLSQSPRPYQTCQFILENSQLPSASFQAAGAKLKMQRYGNGLSLRLMKRGD